MKRFMQIKKTGIFCLIFYLLSSQGELKAQCLINQSFPEGCAGSITFFEAKGTTVISADSLVWKTSVTDYKSNPAAITFVNPGTEKITLEVYKNGSVECTQTVDFVVNELPKADFTLDPNYSFKQCFNGNKFCLKNLSQAAPGNTIDTVTWIFEAMTSSEWEPCFVSGLVAGGKIDVFLRVVDNKGCTDDESKPRYVELIPDIGVSFSTTAITNCGSTVAPFINQSLITFNEVKSFKWDFGDGESYTSKGLPEDSCYWYGPVHTYTKHGCFPVKLWVENLDGCTDSITYNNLVCNINPALDITESNGKDAQCFSGNNFSFTHSIDPLNWPLTFEWNFDDPPSGTQNSDKINFRPSTHEFTGPGIYNVTLNGLLNGCSFFGNIDVIVKGPGAAIENKLIGDVVDDSMRHQCQIKDTVYLTNNSSYTFNDSFPHNDIGIFSSTDIFKSNRAYLMKIDPSVNLFTLENVLDRYFWNGDTFLVVAAPLLSAGQSSGSIVDTLYKYNNFFGAVGGTNKDDHIKSVWDFGDNTAPQCTTWTRYKQNVWDFSKPVYAWRDPVTGYTKTLRGNAELAAEPNKAFITDTTYEWVNCNYSRDITPKHWYTPGTEQCFTITLTAEDTTFASPQDGYKYDYFTYDVNGNVLTDSGGVFNKDIVRFTRKYMLDSVNIYPPKLNAGGDTVWNYNPNCGLEKVSYQVDSTANPVFVAFDTSWTKEWINPNVQNGNNCRSISTLPLALRPPSAEGLTWTGVTCYGPAPPYGVYFDFSQTRPGCTQQFVWFNFDSLADRRDNAPNVFNQWLPQHLLQLNPTTSWNSGTLQLPTWPTRIFKQYQNGAVADSCGWLTVGFRVQNGKHPGTNQPCIDEKWYHNFLRYTPNDSRFSINPAGGCSPLEVEVSLLNEVQDSLISMTFSYRNTDPNKINDIFSEVDSIFRRVKDPVSGNLINYIITYHVYADGSSKKIDSVSYVPGVGGIQACGSELKLKKTRTLRFNEHGRYAIIVTATNTDGCSNPLISYVNIGFFKEAYANKSVICKDETVSFTDSALYYRLFPDPLTGDELLRYNYWSKPEQNFHPDGSARTLPFAQREKVRWNFDQGAGWVSFNGTPTPKPKIVSYPQPGFYQIKVEFTDSLGCADTVTIPLSVSGVTANFSSNLGVDPNACKPVVDFKDLSLVYDPCYIRDSLNRCDSIIRWTWDFGDGSSPFVTQYTINGLPVLTPSHVYLKFGDFDVKLIVETALGCRDTIVRTLSIEGPRPKFEFAVDSIGCVPYTVYIRNISIDPTPNAIWVWNFGDGNSITTKSDSIVYHTYTKSGTYFLTLTQLDAVPLLAGAQCQDTFPNFPLKKVVEVLPERKVQFNADRYEICPEEWVEFTDSSDAIYEDYFWVFGDGDSLKLSKADGGQKVKHQFMKPGNYVVRLIPDYLPQNGEPKCNQSKSILISVREVLANFDVDTTAMPVFRFKNTSVNGTKFWWDYGQGKGYQACELSNPIECPNGLNNYGDQVGTFQVCLVALSPEGCYDTLCREVSNNYETGIHIPNVFTPNGDQVNDFFEVKIKGWLKYEIIIFNRYGDKVYQSTNPDEPWNGRNMNKGDENSAGVYYVRIKYQLRGQSEQDYEGTVTLIRK